MHDPSATLSGRAGMAGGGIEPPHPEYESGVLPLNYPAARRR